MNSYKNTQKINKWIVGIILAIGGIIAVMPFIWMILSAFKTNAEIVSMESGLIPKEWTVQNFIDLFQKMNFGVYLKNTLIITAFSFGGMFLNAMAGYGFAKYRFKGKKSLFIMILATMMIPGQVTMIPVYLILNRMGLTNTLAGIVLPGLVGAYGIFLFRQFMTTISDELLEAARLDGASELYIFTRIILPLSKPF